MLGSAQVEQLNKDCYCFPVDTGALRVAIAGSQPPVGHLLGVNSGLQPVQDEPQPELQQEYRSNLFANTGVLLATAEVDAMMSVIAAIETLVRLSAFRADKIESGPELNRWRCGQGALMGYDFHLGAAGPRLIEINTNAGGAFIVNEMMSYCDQVLPECCGFYSPAYDHENLKNLLKAEWQTSGRHGMPAVAAIVDSNPQSEYLYPDMLIAKNYFEQSGVETIVTDVAALAYKEGVLSCNGKKIDLVYNRSTDFSMTDTNHTALREAALADAVLVGPNPVHHALYANKRNFLDLVDQNKLEGYGLAPQHRATLQEHVPHTALLTPDNAEELHKQRRSLFFKPVDGFGSRAVYRGDKITRRVWNELLQSVEQGQEYIAQEVIPPTLRALVADGERKQLKFDVRIYTAGGVAVMAAARVYQGQTTNFRTAGGGFAPVYYMPQA